MLSFDVFRACPDPFNIFQYFKKLIRSMVAHADFEKVLVL